MDALRSDSQSSSTGFPFSQAYSYSDRKATKPLIAPNDIEEEFHTLREVDWDDSSNQRWKRRSYSLREGKDVLPHDRVL